MFKKAALLLTLIALALIFPKSGFAQTVDLVVGDEQTVLYAGREAILPFSLIAGTEIPVNGVQIAGTVKSTGSVSENMSIVLPADSQFDIITQVIENGNFVVLLAPPNIGDEVMINNTVVFNLAFTPQAEGDVTFAMDTEQTLVASADTSQNVLGEVSDITFQVNAQTVGQGISVTEVPDSAAQSGYSGLREAFNYVLLVVILIAIAVTGFIGWKWYTRRKMLKENPSHRVYGKANGREQTRAIPGIGSSTPGTQNQQSQALPNQPQTPPQL